MSTKLYAYTIIACNMHFLYFEGLKKGEIHLFGGFIISI